MEEDEELYIRWEFEEILKRYAAGEREFLYIDLSGADLSKVDFGERRLRNITYIERIKFIYANFTNANLSGANFQGAFMEFINLTNANLSGANLENAQLAGANLRDANLKNANLCGTNFAGADLTNADLSGAIWGFNGKDTIFNNTILPDGTIRSERY